MTPLQLNMENIACLLLNVQYNKLHKSVATRNAYIF